MAFEYGFAQQLEMSNGVATNSDVKSVLLQSIPGSLNVVKAATENDKSGVDWWVEMAGCRHIAVDAKVRSTDYATRGMDDLALETWSVVESSVIGWTRDTTKMCDYVLWLWTETNRWCLVPFPMLCGVFVENWQQWIKEFKVAQQKTNTGYSQYHSECVFVPRLTVWREIYNKYGGVKA